MIEYTEDLRNAVEEKGHLIEKIDNTQHKMDNADTEIRKLRTEIAIQQGFLNEKRKDKKRLVRLYNRACVNSVQAQLSQLGVVEVNLKPAKKGGKSS